MSVVYFETNRGGSFIYSKLPISKKKLDKTLNKRKSKFHKECNEKYIRTIVGYWKLGGSIRKTIWAYSFDDDAYKNVTMEYLITLTK